MIVIPAMVYPPSAGGNPEMISSKYVIISLSLCLCITGSLSAADKPDKIVDVNFAPGKEVRVDADGKRVGIDHFMVYVPSDYNDKQNWPVIFFYPGQGGRPMTWPFRQITQGRGFIVVGMGYVTNDEGPMNEAQYIDYMKRQRRSLLEVKRYLSEHLKIDENRLFVSGCSKGGWHTAALLESGPKIWAGAVIFAAGRTRAVNLLTSNTAKQALRGKPIYIGAGETDANLSAAKKAVTYYEKIGVKVTFEEYKGQGHICSPPNPEKLYNWLIENSAADSAESKRTKEGNAAEQVE
ncbi:MAG: prolyl oligopeptidase family serine peptidase [Sedimentisphaerales bacterium]|nr:prolyl oligopeptidase family serine peptidase [Sedimentisphaerales bacterium]